MYRKSPVKGSFWYSTELNSALLALRDAKITFQQANETMDEEEKMWVKQLYSEAIKILWEVQSNDRQYVDEILDKLAEKRGKEWQQNTKSTLKSIKAAEHTKGIFQQITTTVKGIKKGGIRQLMIPTENNPSHEIKQNETGSTENWIQINYTEQIF